MSIPGGANPLLLATAAAAADAGPFSVTRSLRFNSADSAYLNRTPSSAGNRKTWTWSGWVKRANLGSEQAIFGAWTDNSNRTIVRFDSSDKLQFLYQNGGTFYGVTSAPVFRDPGAFFHLVLVMDTTASTSTDRVKVYVNGSQIADGDLSSFGSGKYPPQNTEYQINSTTTHHIGARKESGSFTNTYLNAYLANIELIDGQALAPTDFAETDSDNNWNPKAFSGGSYGSNGFYLKFADNSSNAALGTDSSGNNNTFTVNNLTADGGVLYSASGSGTVSGTKTFDKAFDGSTSTFCEPSDNQTITFDFTNLPGGGIAVSSSLRIYLNKAGTPAAGHFTVNGTNLGGSVPSGAYLTISSVTLLETITFFHQSVSSSVELYAVEVDGTVLQDGSPLNTDCVIDVPANSDADSGNNRGNYAVLNPLNMHNTSNSFSEGNLKFTTSGSDGCLQESTIAMSSGKFYFEAVYSRSDQGQFAGIRKPGSRNYDDSYIYTGTANKYTNGGSGASYGATLAHDDVIGTAFDADNGTLTFYKNGVSQGQAFSGISGTYAFFVGSFGSAPTGVVNFGQQPFTYTPPTGHKSLCTQNLPDPTIADGSDYFDIDLYQGTGASHTRSGFSFSPDWIWIKVRDAGSSHRVFDTVRGAGKHLLPDDQGTEGTHTAALSGFTSDGYTLGSNNDGATNVNQDSKNYVGWLWDAGSSTVTNNDGNRTSNVRASAASGFSIVSWNGNRTSGTTLGHGLSAAPELIIAKNRETSTNWMVYHKAAGHSGYLALNTNAAFGTASSVWNNTAPTNSVFTVGQDTESNGDGDDMIAYCFTSVDGYCKVGSFENPSSSLGAFVHCGFRPAFILAKCAKNISSSSGAGDWIIKDTTRSPFNNPSDGNTLASNVANSEDGYYSATQAAVDILSNGFKIRHPNSSPLGDPGRLYIFLAIAEHPFKTARAR
jgi:hypothetical protein